MTSRVIELRHYSHGSLPGGFKQMVLDVHSDAYADAMNLEFTEKFPWFLDHWSGMKGFTCVVSFDGEEPTGLAYGAPQEPGREWWRDTDYVPDGGHTSTYAISEVMVRPRWRKQGIADRLYEGLMKDRSEDLAVLLVEVAKPRVQQMYERWGFVKAGEQQPMADSPIYAVMVKNLRV